MTQKIDEVVDKLIPLGYVIHRTSVKARAYENGIQDQRRASNFDLKQAILRGELWIPVSVEELTKIIDDKRIVNPGGYPTASEIIATAIHTMMKERK